MLISGERALALRCAQCGRMQRHRFQLFELAGGRKELSCRCGATQGITTVKGGAWTIWFTCLICERQHWLRVPLAEVAKRPLWPLVCGSGGVEVGLAGAVDAVADAVDHDERCLESVVHDPDCKEYFHNPRVMEEALATLQAIAEVGRLSCECGNHAIDVDIYPDKVELMCSQCGSVVLLYAETEDDLEVIESLQGLTMPQGGFSCVDARAHTQRSTRG